MKKFILTRTGDIPLEFVGECLTDPEASIYQSAYINVFKTASGRYILYVGNYGHGQSHFTQVQRAYFDAEKLTPQEIIGFCGNDFENAKPILLALNKPIMETIE